jgi:phosphate transport system permease protein
MTTAGELNLKSRIRRNRIFRGLVIFLASLSVVPIILITLKILIKGIGQINFSFFSETSPDSLQAMAAVAGNETIPGGIANGITGTLLIVLLAAALSIPAGLLTGVYLAGNSKSRYSSIIRSVAEMLQGVPSIVLGIISYL